MFGFVKKIFGDPNQKELDKLQPAMKKINALEADIKALPDEGLKAKTPEFKARLADGASLDDLLPEAYAVVREAAIRVLGQRAFDT
ncbi:MAG: hypothetical protein RBT40_12960, partial [Petrimonas sp.]|nr:hypothetical protein [Petrimonas sp.]